MSGTTAIISARLHSSRLPYKIVLPLAGKPLLWHVIRRTQQVFGHVVVATDPSSSREVNIICRSTGCDLHVGSPIDVLDRVYQAAANFQSRDIVRITGDCPLIDPGVLYELHNKSQICDVTAVATGVGVGKFPEQINRFPDGMDAEIISMEILQELWETCIKPEHREHPTLSLWEDITNKNNDEYVWDLVTADKDYYPIYKFSVDTVEDYDFVSDIYHNLYDNDRIFTFEDVINYLEE